MLRIQSKVRLRGKKINLFSWNISQNVTNPSEIYG